MKKEILILSLGLIMFFACKESKTTTTDKITTVDKVDNCDGASFNAVNTIINESCIKCHNGPKGKAGVDMSNIEVVKSLASSGKLLCVLEGKECKKMPPSYSGSISADQQNLIDCWIKNGMKE